MTDQLSNHRCHLAYVRALVGGRAEVVHVYIAKGLLTSVHHASALQELKRGANTSWVKTDPVVLFRDSECTHQAMLDRARTDMQSLEVKLRQTISHLCGVVFNPMSEGAFLLFPTARSILTDEFAVPLDPAWIADKRSDRFVHKQQLDRALGLASHSNKRALDKRMEADVANWLTSAEPVFTQVTARLRAVLDAALGVP
ncbi:MAG: hypothetical protein ABMA64_10740 [Myxococcota bacterium]